MASHAPLLGCLLAAALFGSSTPAAKVLLDGVGPVTLAGLFYLGAAAFASLFVRPRQVRVPRSARNLGLLGGAVLAGGVVGPIAMLLGVKLAPAATSALWLNLETPATALLGLLLFREHLTPRGWAAVVVVTGASVLLAAPGGFALAPAALLFVLACAAWGLDNNLTALVDGFTPAESTFAKGLGAGLVNLGLAAGIGEAWPPAALVAGALAVGALAYGASLILYVGAAQHLGATRSQLVFATAPFFGVALAWTALGEPVATTQLAAACLMALGVVAGARDRHVHRHVHPAVRHIHWHRHDDGHHGHAHKRLPLLGWHAHEHEHEVVEHAHAHRSDLHHRHAHGG